MDFVSYGSARNRGSQSRRSVAAQIPSCRASETLAYIISIRSIRTVSEATIRDERNGAGSRIRTDDLLITNQLLYQLSYAGIYEGKPSILIHFFRPLYPPFVSLRQKRAQRADSVPLPLRTVRIPSSKRGNIIHQAGRSLRAL